MAPLRFAIVLLVAGAVSAGEIPLTAKEILLKMAKAIAVSDYQGTVVFLKNGKLEAMKYSHTIEKEGEKERLVSLNSPQREIIRTADEIRCFYKLTRQVIIDHRPYEHSFIVDVPKNLDDLDTSYQFEVVGEEDVAMMPSYVVAIQPKDDFRYIRKIWVTKSQFLPLKAVVYDLTGIVLEQVVFTEVQINNSPVATKSNPNEPDNGNVKQAAAETIGVSSPSNQATFETTGMPQGFKQIFFSRKPLGNSEQPVDHLLLSDGFASVSVYLETKKPGASPPDSRLPEGMHSVGAVNSMSRNLADSQLTVLGEVPATTVKFIAEGVKLRNAGK